MTLFNHLTPNTQIVMMITYAILVIAEIFVRSLHYFRPALKLDTVKDRIKGWWGIVILFTLAIVGTRGTMLFFVGLVSYLATKEFFSLIPTRRVDRRILFWVYLAIPVQFTLVYLSSYEAFLTFIPVFLFLFIAFRMALTEEIDGFLKAAATAQFGLITTVFSLSHIAYLVNFPAASNPAGGWAGLILFLIFLTEGNDVSQFICGKLFGRYKILPKVSPNKTLEGFLGGVVCTTIMSCALAPILTPIGFPLSISVGLLISFSGFIGDIVMSAVKRDLGIKDFGTVLAGHGGILDRVDSLIFTAPLFFYLLRAYFWGSTPLL